MSERFPQPATPIIEKSFIVSSDEKIAKALELAKLRLGLPTLPEINTSLKIGEISRDLRGILSTCNNDGTRNKEDMINFEN